MAEDFGEEATRNAWAQLDAMPVARQLAEAWVRPEKYQALILDRQQITDVLRLAPLESNVGDVKNSNFVVSIPMPDGSFARFRVVESPIMAPGLAAQLPDIHTYLGQGIDDPTATIRFDLTPQGFHAQVLSHTSGSAYIDPYNRGDDTLYTSYWKRDLGTRPDFFCTGPEGVEALERDISNDIVNLRSTGTTRKEYMLACCATGEYTTFHGGTQALGQAAVVTAINRVTGVYETELAIRLILVANNINVIYTNSATDPFNNLNDGTMLTQTINTCNSVIGSANYDIGHSFGTGGGGVAGLSVVCGASKGRGTTGLPSPTGDGFWIDYVAHEMGHQFGGNHCFNGGSTNCVGNRNASTAYEPGSGSTIMAYAGVCSALDNIQNNSDPYFHFISIQEISAFINGAGNACATAVNTGNNQPTVNAGIDYTVPSGTPFVLTAASGSDPDGDAVTYCWEERDLGPAQVPGVVGGGAPDNGSSPLFRSFSPTTSNSRTLPRLSAVLANTLSVKIERVPTTNRTMNFRCTIRDNRAGSGGANSDDMNVIVTNAGGAFSVTSPNTAASLTFGRQFVTWNVAATNIPPVSVSSVRILLSLDGGTSFPIVLAASTPNDGSQLVQFPTNSSSTARVKIEAIGNIFYDVSNTNFSLNSSGLASDADPFTP